MPQKKFRLKGMDKLMKRINEEVQQIEGRTLKGIIRSVILIHRDVEPMIPVDLGNLRASWFTVTTTGEGKTLTPSFNGDAAAKLSIDHHAITQAAQANLPQGKRQPAARFGFTANYASWVHENVGANFQRTGAEARFLYKAIRRNEDNILETIRQDAQIK